MKRSMFTSTTRNLSVIATLCLGLALFLTGCPEFSSTQCPSSCGVTVPEPGIYSVTYLGPGDLPPSERMKTVTETAGDVGRILICDCEIIVGEPVLIQAAALSVGITDLPDPVNQFDSISYYIKIDNNVKRSPSLTLTDMLPPGVTFLYTDESECTYSNGTVTCNFEPREGVSTVSLGIHVMPTVAGTITNTVSVTANGFAVQTATATTTVNPGVLADLSVAIIDSPDPVTVNQPLTYGINIHNSGPSTATRILLSAGASLSSSVTTVSATPTQGSCTQAERGEANCNLGSLANGATATVTIVVTPTAAGTIYYGAGLVSETNEHNTANNNATATTTVIPAATGADLAVTITDSPDPVARNGTLTYTITITNNSATAATGVTLEDIVARVQPGSVTLSQGSFTQSNLDATITTTCNFGTLAGGATATATIVVFPLRAGTLTNSARVTADGINPITTSENTTVN
jgi:uncharacterized repeat protein (TIGR01451 family)